ncbi:MAG: hypothetical protein ACI9P5_002991 [Saprospiraceae bacterium]|jgi:hypothetical protein
MHRVFFSLFVLILLGCSESTIIPETTESDLHYFPVQTGQYRIYDVDEVIFTVLGSDTSHYELKESVVDSFVNTTNSISYIVNRETRLTTSEPWSLDSVWTARISNIQAVLVENNVNIIKLVFPIEQGLSWNGNELNSRNEKQFTYDLNVPDTTLFENQFSDGLRVVQSNIPENLINRDERFEIYAKGVGLIIKSTITLEFCQMDCPETKSIESGRIFKATLKEYGSE